jgi:hypothetical protein
LSKNRKYLARLPTSDEIGINAIEVSTFRIAQLCAENGSHDPSVDFLKLRQRAFRGK